MFHDIEERQIKDHCRNSTLHMYFFYTPLCGTCKLAQKMCTVAMETVPNTTIYSCNVNHMPTLVAQWEISSVPCLILAQGGEIVHKMYAFESVEKVYTLIKSLPRLANASADSMKRSKPI